jgi:hypothetical protein
MNKFEEGTLGRIKNNENAFRDILWALRENREIIPNWDIIPPDLDNSAPFDEIIKRYCSFNRNWVFEIISFEVSDNWNARIMFSDQIWLSWKWAWLEYEINDNKAKLLSILAEMRS